MPVWVFVTIAHAQCYKTLAWGETDLSLRGGHFVAHHLWLFLAAVFGHYVTAMSGIVSFGLAFWQRAKGRNVTDNIFWLIAIVFLSTALFQAWDDQFNRAEQLQVQLNGMRGVGRTQNSRLKSHNSRLICGRA
jgi:hypothetical protein